MTECTASTLLVCSECRIGKPATEFWKHGRRRDNLMCKKCDAIRLKKFREVWKARSDEEIESAAAQRPFRTCSKCKLTKTYMDFPKERSAKYGRSARCLACARTASAEYHANLSVEERCIRRRSDHGNNREKYRRDALLARFFITRDEYLLLLEAQNGVCAICKLPETSVRNGRTQELQVDHCHVTGKLRALLCGYCNRGLGGFRDNPVWLRRAAMYIQYYTDNDQDYRAPLVLAYS